MAATNGTNRQNVCILNDVDRLANSSTVSGEEEIIWIEEEEEGNGTVIKENKKAQEGTQENVPKMELLDVASSKGGDNTLSSSLEIKDADRFPDEISISAESEEQSDQQDDREIEPNRLLATLENLAIASTKQNDTGDSTTSNSTNQKGEEQERMSDTMVENGLQKLSNAGGQAVQLTIFPSSVEASESKAVELGKLIKDSVETNERKNNKEFPLDDIQQKGNGTDRELMKPSKALEEFGWQMTTTIIPIEKDEETTGRVDKGTIESISNEGKNDLAIQFSFKSIPKTETPPSSASEELDNRTVGETKANIDEDMKEGGENDDKILEVKETAPKMETRTEETVEKKEQMMTEKLMESEAAGMPLSSPQLSVRFADGQRSERECSLKDEDLAKLEEYEEKMRRRSKEALELVDRICGLQVKEGEKNPPLPKHKSIEESSNSRKSSANTSSGEQEKDQLKEALVAGIHGLSGASEKGRTTEPVQIKQSSIQQIDEGPILNVESVSVNSSILQSPSDCVLLPGGQLLILDSDAGFSLISLESKQMVKQLSPKQGIWRNAECACFDGENIYVLLEYNVNSAVSEANMKMELTASKEKGSPIDDQQKDRQKADKNEEGEENASSKKETKSTNVQPRGILKSNNGPNGELTNKKNDEPDWRQFICRFSISDFGMIDRIEAPKWLRERVVWHCRMCFVPQTKCLYLAANTPNQGFIFELRCGEARWTECVGTRRHSQFADLHHFAVVGPVTELLLVETNRSYVQLVSIYNSNVVSSRTLGICENPGALCVDEKGHVLIFDRATATVGLFSRAFLEKIFDLALVERAHCQLSARQGVLAILCRVTREIRIHRYGDKLHQIEEMLYEGRSEPSI